MKKSFLWASRNHGRRSVLGQAHRVTTKGEGNNSKKIQEGGKNLKKKKKKKEKKTVKGGGRGRSRVRNRLNLWRKRGALWHICSEGEALVKERK